MLKIIIIIIISSLSVCCKMRSSELSGKAGTGGDEGDAGTRWRQRPGDRFVCSLQIIIQLKLSFEQRPPR